MPHEPPSARGRARLFGDIVIIVFLVSQVMDGAMTYLGVQTFGRSIEANPILVWLMGVVGDGPALAAAKTAAATFGALLHLTAVHRVLALLTGIYLAAAIVPWTKILFF